MEAVQGCSKVVNFPTSVRCQSCSKFLPLKFFSLIETSTCLGFLRPEVLHHITVWGFLFEFFCGVILTANCAKCCHKARAWIIVPMSSLGTWLTYSAPDR